MSTERAVLISGGGAWGAFGAGTLARIDGDYDTIIGVSTGSLLAPYAALKEWDKLKEEFTNITNSDVIDESWYKPNAISKSGKVRIFPIVMALLFGNKTISTSNALRNTIDRIFPEEYYDELELQNKEVVVGAQNFAQTPSKIHYFSNLDVDYEEFKDWMWCSSNFPFFTSLVKKSWKTPNGDFHVGLWSDGGVSDLKGIEQLMMKGFSEIDIILHRTKPQEILEGNRINNLVDNIRNTIAALRYDIELECFYDKIRRLNKHGAQVRIFWLPRKLSENSIVFNRNEMIDWWEEGYETAFDANRMEIFPPIKKSF